MKQVIVMRTDLNMRKGKMVAQGSHASMKPVVDSGSVFVANGGARYLMIPLTPEMDEWLMKGVFKKICCGVNSEAELLELLEKAKAAGITCSLITDSGLTEFSGVPTNTCISVGPAENDKINAITGHLKLL